MKPGSAPSGDAGGPSPSLMPRRVEVRQHRPQRPDEHVAGWSFSSSSWWVGDAAQMFAWLNEGWTQRAVVDGGVYTITSVGGRMLVEYQHALDVEATELGRFPTMLSAKQQVRADIAQRAAALTRRRGHGLDNKAQDASGV